MVLRTCTCCLPELFTTWLFRTLQFFAVAIFNSFKLTYEMSSFSITTDLSPKRLGKDNKIKGNVTKRLRVRCKWYFSYTFARTDSGSNFSLIELNGVSLNVFLSELPSFTFNRVDRYSRKGHLRHWKYSLYGSNIFSFFSNWSFWKFRAFEMPRCFLFGSFIRSHKLIFLTLYYLHNYVNCEEIRTAEKFKRSFV